MLGRQAVIANAALFEPRILGTNLPPGLELPRLADVRKEAVLCMILHVFIMLINYD